jgi:ribosomal protein S8E
MDATELAQQVMTALTPIAPYLNAVGTAIATKFGEDIYQRGKRLYEAIHTRFAQEPDEKASKALQAFVNDPDLSGGVEIKLVRLIQADPSFALTLRQILQSGPQMTIDASDDAIVHKNKMRNAQEHGSQTIIAHGNAQVTENEMNISYE